MFTNQTVRPGIVPPILRALFGCVDIELRRGEILGLIGGARAGKTMLLQCLAGLRRPYRGSVELSGLPLDRSRCPLPIGFVPALPVYYPFLTPRDVLEYRAARLSGAEVAPGAIDRALDALGLGGSESTVIANFSRDHIRRLAIAEALVGGANAVLVDSYAGDRGTIYSCATLAAFRKIAASGVAIVLAARSASSVIAVASRLMVLRDRREGFAAWETPLYLARDERIPSLQHDDARRRELRAR